MIKLLVLAALFLAFLLTVGLVGSVVGFLLGKAFGMETDEAMTSGRVGALVGLIVGAVAHYGLGLTLPGAYISAFDLIPGDLVAGLVLGAAGGTTVQRLRH